MDTKNSNLQDVKVTKYNCKQSLFDAQYILQRYYLQDCLKEIVFLKIP